MITKLIKVTTFIIIFNFSSHAQSIKNLVFEGAGVRGIAYAGVMKSLEEHDMITGIEKVGGTSAGAIMALMVCLDYKSSEIDTILSGLETELFHDGSGLFVGGSMRMSKEYGWYKGDVLQSWIRKLIKYKSIDENITLSQLYEKTKMELKVTATCINKQKLIFLSYETYPNMRVSDAIRISISIPLYFTAMFVDAEGKVYENYEPGLDIMIDGGIIGNFPIDMFDTTYIEDAVIKRSYNPNTLGFRIDTDAQIANDSTDQSLAEMPVGNFNEYLRALYSFTLENLNRHFLTPQDWERTVSISSCGIGSKIRKLSNTEKQTLYNSGLRSTSKFLNKVQQQ